MYLLEMLYLKRYWFSKVIEYPSYAIKAVTVLVSPKPQAFTKFKQNWNTGPLSLPDFPWCSNCTCPELLINMQKQSQFRATDFRSETGAAGSVVDKTAAT